MQHKFERFSVVQYSLGAVTIIRLQRVITLYMNFLKYLFADKRTKVLVSLHKGDYFAFYKAPEHLKSDPYIVSLAVRLNGYTLQDASSNLKADKKIVWDAVMQVGGALKYASKALQNDRKFVLEIVTRRPDAFEFVSAELKADREVISMAAAAWPGCFEFAAEHLKADKSFLKYVINRISENIDGRKYFCDFFYTIDKRLLADREFMIFAVLKSGCALSAADEKLKDDKQVVLAAVKADGSSLQYASEAMRRDRDVAMTALRNQCSAIDFVPHDVPWYDEVRQLDSR
jgi:hypothetical protein